MPCVDRQSSRACTSRARPLLVQAPHYVLQGQCQTTGTLLALLRCSRVAAPRRVSVVVRADLSNAASSVKPPKVGWGCLVVLR